MKSLYYFATKINFFSKSSKYSLIEKKMAPLHIENEELKTLVYKYNDLLNHNFKYSDHLKYNNQLEQITDQYFSNNNQLLKTMNQTNVIQVGQIIQQYNIIQLDIWKKYVQQMLISKVSIKDLKDCLSKIVSFSKRFRMFESQEYKLYFPEKEFYSILQSQDILTLEKILVYDPSADINDFVECIGFLNQLITKIQRISYIDFKSHHKFIEERILRLKSLAGQLTLENQISLYETLLEVEEPDQLNELAARIAEQPLITDYLTIQRILEIWKHFGVHSVIIYEKISAVLQQNIIKSERLHLLIKIAYGCIVSNIRDQQLYQIIIKQIEALYKEFEKLTKLQKEVIILQTKLFHICLRLVKLRVPQVVIPSEWWTISNGFCNGSNISADTCALSEHVKKSQGQKSYQELSIVSFLKQHLKNSFKEAEFMEDCQSCQFSIDLALFIKEKKFAIEISGFMYASKGKLKGKKQAKFDILKEDGWIPIIIETSDDNVHKASSFKKGLNMMLYKQIEKQIHEHLT